MTAIAIREPGPPDVLVPQERDMPAPKAGEVLVKVAAAGVNRPDVMQREGKYPPPPGAPDIPGLEIAGEVVALGEGVQRWKVGDKVTRARSRRRLCRIRGGARDQRAAGDRAAHDGRGGAIPETFFTVWHNVFERGALKAGETMLIHGGSSGIGTTAIMLAKCHGARVIVTVGSEEKAEACRKLGADVAINYNTQDFVAETKKATDGKGAELIVDMVAGDYIQKNYEAAAMDGRIVQIAFQRPPKVAGRFPPDAGEAAVAHRLRPASAPGAREGRDRARGRGERLAADRGRQGEAGDLQDLPAARGRGRACPDGDERSISARSC